MNDQFGERLIKISMDIDEVAMNHDATIEEMFKALLLSLLTEASAKKKSVIKLLGQLNGILVECLCSQIESAIKSGKIKNKKEKK